MLQIIKDIFLLPVHLFLFVIKRIAYRINKEEFELKKKMLDSSYKTNRQIRAQLDAVTQQNENYKKNKNKIIDLLERDNFYTREIFSRNDEILIVYYNSNDIFDSIYLLGEYGEYGDHPTNDSRINLSLHGNNLKIDDFISNTKNKGYGRFLLKFLIEKAKNNNLEEIYGDLSPEDSSNFIWLIPFYESLGFTCTLFNDPAQKMNGEIRLKL